jgi:hypothetical protein
MNKIEPIIIHFYQQYNEYKILIEQLEDKDSQFFVNLLDYEYLFHQKEAFIRL